MVTATQKKTAQAIINIFETGAVLGDYSQVTLIEGDTGHLTYGRSQTTLGSGNLSKLIQRYCANLGARFGGRLSPYLPAMASGDVSLDSDLKLHNLLRASADDLVMRDTQDSFFDKEFWQPAVRAASREGVTSPLGVAVIYDSFVHGSWKTIRSRTRQQVGDVASVGEQKWITTYITLRRAWLAGSSRVDLRLTVYRMDAFKRLIDQGYWGLTLPLVVRDKEITLAALSASPLGCYDGPMPGSRSLTLQPRLMRGLDVRLLQLGVSELGMDIKADGIFGQTSYRRMKEFQSTHGLPATGTADISQIVQLTKGLWG